MSKIKNFCRIISGALFALCMVFGSAFGDDVYSIPVAVNQAGGTGNNLLTSLNVMDIDSSYQEIDGTYETLPVGVYYSNDDVEVCTFGSGNSSFNYGVCDLVGKTVFYKRNPPTKTGYVFDGYWTQQTGGIQYIDKNGNVTQNLKEAIGLEGDNNIYPGPSTIYAHWTALPGYTVTLKNGSTTVTTVQATAGSAMPTLSITAPTKTGYTLAGWYDATTGGTKYYNANGTSAHVFDKTSDTTLYARWISTITLNKDTGDTNANPSVLYVNPGIGIYGSVANAISHTNPLFSDYNNCYLTTVPTKSGYAFKAFLTPDGTENLIDNTGRIIYCSYLKTNTSNMTIGARYTQLGSFSLVPNISDDLLNSRGDTGLYYTLSPNQAVKYNSTTHAYEKITKINPPIPKSSGYVFDGYNGSDYEEIYSDGTINTGWLNSLSTIGNGSNQALTGSWHFLSVTCSAGQYFDKTLPGCADCPAGYYCPSSGTYNMDSTNDGKILCGTDTYATGSATSCSSCLAGFHTTASGTDNSTFHDQAQDCKITITLLKNGGTGNIVAGGTTYSGTTNGQIVCSAYAYCDLPKLSGLSQTGYAAFTGWGTEPSCKSSSTSISFTSANPTTTYYACKSSNQIYIKWYGVATAGSGFTTVSGQANTYTSTVPYGGDIVTPVAAVASSAGQTFLGWKFEK